MKFAQVGYGSEGQGKGENGTGYTYLVNDNVRTGDTINPSVIHWRSGNIFGTTGKILPQGLTKTTSKKGQELQADLKSKNIDVADALTGKELGIQKTRGAGGRFTADRSTHDENGNYVASKFELGTRGGNIEARKQQQLSLGLKGEVSTATKTQEAVETFDSYSKPFMKGGNV